MGALCNQAPPILQNDEVAAMSVTSTQSCRLSGRAARDSFEATALAMDEHPRCTASMLHCSCA